MKLTIQPMLRLENLTECCNWNRQHRDLRTRNKDFTSYKKYLWLLESPWTFQFVNKACWQRGHQPLSFSCFPAFICSSKFQGIEKTIIDVSVIGVILCTCIHRQLYCSLWWLWPHLMFGWTSNTKKMYSQPEIPRH